MDGLGISRSVRSRHGNISLINQELSLDAPLDFSNGVFDEIHMNYLLSIFWTDERDQAENVSHVLKESRRVLNDRGRIVVRDSMGSIEKTMRLLDGLKLRVQSSRIMALDIAKTMSETLESEALAYEADSNRYQPPYELVVVKK